MDFSPELIRWIIQGLIILILSIAVHEFGHAYVAHKLGDRTPSSQGRLTLNPLAHADPIGTLLFPILGLVFTKGAGFGFGWGRPVEVQPILFTRRFTMRTGHLFVAIAGPVMNLLFGLLIALVHVILLRTGTLTDLGFGAELSRALQYAVRLNFILAFFNLIPAPPLDGGAVVRGLLPYKWLDGFDRFSTYGPFVLMAVIFIPGLSLLFVMPALWLQDGLYTVLLALFGLT
ncbi:site-2 protease family protein [Haliangium sp.]|uniref:site-2 protease family protein n=1 Tax=Haliangium sp. TaxID=2663208 RepID=UPI003D0C3A52